MNGQASRNWHEANQHYLTAALALIRQALHQHAAQGNAGLEVEPGALMATNGLQQALQRAAVQLPGPSALDTLSMAFALSPFERDVLLMCAGMELDAGFAALCAAAQGDARRAYPTFSLALASLPEAHWSAITPAGPLRLARHDPNR